MRVSTDLRTLAGVGTALTVSLALMASGCGGKDASESTVSTEPGVKVETGGATAPAASAPTAAAPTAAPTSAAAPAAAKAEGWGTFKGQVVFGGAAPAVEIQVPQGQAPKDPEVCAKNAPIKSERVVVDEATKGVKNVLVYFSKVDAAAINPDAKAAAAKAGVVFDQKACVFEPHVLAVMAGAKIELKSSDPVNHNVNARFRANAQFNSVLAANQQVPYTPISPERQPTQVTCDIHPWMLAYWMILDHPYFAVTDAKGNFEIKDVPAGAQKVVVWQEGTGFVTAPQGEDVTIVAKDTASKNFTIDPSKVKK